MYFTCFTKKTAEPHGKADWADSSALYLVLSDVRSLVNPGNSRIADLNLEEDLIPMLDTLGVDIRNWEEELSYEGDESTGFMFTLYKDDLTGTLRDMPEDLRLEYLRSRLTAADYQHVDLDAALIKRIRENYR